MREDQRPEPKPRAKSVAAQPLPATGSTPRAADPRRGAEGVSGPAARQKPPAARPASPARPPQRDAGALYPEGGPLKPRAAAPSRPAQRNPERPYPEGGYQARPRPSSSAYRKPPSAGGRGPYRDAELLYPDDGYYKKQPAARKPRKKKGKKRKKAGPFRTVMYVLIAVAAAWVISMALRTFAFEVVRVEGNAMNDGLVSGDWALVTKFDYWSAAPQRGDVVAIALEPSLSDASAQGIPLSGTIIRRVIAMPKETVQIQDGNTFVDGVALDQPYVVNDNRINFGPYTLKNIGRYFVLSDNRSNMLDSRDGRINDVPKRDIEGKVRAVIWPLSRFGKSP